MERVIIFHSPLPENAPPDELDVLNQAAYFKNGLQDLGFAAQTAPFPYDLMELGEMIKEQKPLFVVNLVETLFSSGRLAHIPPYLFEQFGVPYSGCPAEALFVTSNKILAKQVLKSEGILTPNYLSYESLVNGSPFEPGIPMLVKSLWEHASYGMDESRKLLFDQREELLEQMEASGRPENYFAEKYIHGREFNLSVADGPKRPQVLPPAEIRFTYPAGKPRIVGYRAKWDETSFAYINTVRSFDFTRHDQALLKQLEDLSLKCWKVFGLKAYARVDFRVDESGNIYVLEVNANPCISPESGFVAAAAQAGINQKELIGRIIQKLNQPGKCRSTSS